MVALSFLMVTKHGPSHAQPSASWLICHYEGSSAAPRNVCRLDVGRGRFDRDCSSQQSVCGRFRMQLGVCEPAL